jgi:hypothetical protein
MTVKMETRFKYFRERPQVDSGERWTHAFGRDEPIAKRESRRPSRTASPCPFRELRSCFGRGAFLYAILSPPQKLENLE